MSLNPLTWRCKKYKDNLEMLQKDIETIASHGLDEFKASSESGDKQALTSHTQVVLDTLTRVQDNNKVLVSNINRVTGWISSLTSRDLNGFLVGRALHFLVSSIDGKRDNFSYYMFEAAREWIDRRKAFTTGSFNSNLSSSRNLIVEARDDLDSNAQVFVQGIKKIRQLTASGRSGENQGEIRSVVNQFDRMKETSAFVQKTEAAIHQVQETIKTLETA